MKVIDIPEPVVADMGKSSSGTKVVIRHSLPEVLERALDMYEPLGKGYKNIMKAVKIHGKLEKASQSGAETLHLEDEEYEVLKSAFEAAVWAPRFARQIGSFYEAVMGAEEAKETAV